MQILSTAYLGNIQYFSKLLNTQPTVIDIYENYQKQSFRTRCDILAANGIVSLTVPVLKISGEKTLVKDIRIDYSKEWRHQHRMSIISAYKNSPYFEYFEDEFLPLYDKKFEFLVDLNMNMQEIILGIMGVKTQIDVSKEFINIDENDIDLKNCMSPKPRLNKSDQTFIAEHYYQVFSEKYDFAPNLSIIDLLFCEGTEAATIIRESTR